MESITQLLATVVGTYLPQIVTALAWLLLGLIAALLASRGTVALLRRRLTPQGAMVARRLVYYLILGLAAISALNALGFQLGVLLGAAGILTVALGFASQTSASNLISGLFLIGERAFEVGDLIRVGETTGEVLSIDLLSVKLRTFDNLYVRIPNESLIKSEITNLTRFPVRRVDVRVTVAYKEELERVREVLLEVAEANPLCLVEPKPLFLVVGFGDSGVELLFAVWGIRENFIDLKNSIHQEIKQAFEQNGIEIPYPHRQLRFSSGGVPPALAEQPEAKQGPTL